MKKPTVASGPNGRFSGSIEVQGEPKSYISFLLRLYRVQSEEGWTWRASLEDPLSGERHAFPDLQTLFAFLEAKAGEETNEKQQKESGGEP